VAESCRGAGLVWLRVCRMCCRGAGLMFDGLPEWVAGSAVKCYWGAGLMPLLLPESRLNGAGRLPGMVGDPV
jgi:hypothetical protein